MPSPAASPPSSMPPPAASSRRRALQADRQGLRRPPRHHRRADRGPDRLSARRAAATIRGLRHTPAGAFGSARFKLKSLEQNRAEYERLIEVFRAHDIGYFFYNGGNDSMDTALKVSQIGAAAGLPDHLRRRAEDRRQRPAAHRLLPGLRLGGQVHRRLARARPRSTWRRWRARRPRCSCSRSWAGTPAGSPPPAASPAAAGRGAAHHPVPGNPLRPGSVPGQASKPASTTTATASSWSPRARVSGRQVPGRSRHQGCLRPRAAGRRRPGGRQHGAGGARLQVSLGGRRLPAARGAPHRLEDVDVEQAYAVGKAAVEFAVKGMNAVMPTIVRKSAKPYRWTHRPRCRWTQVANVEKKVPRDFITADGFGITAACRRYLRAADRRRGLPALPRWPAGYVQHQAGRAGLPQRRSTAIAQTDCQGLSTLQLAGGPGRRLMTCATQVRLTPGLAALGLPARGRAGTAIATRAHFRGVCLHGCRELVVARDCRPACSQCSTASFR